MRKLEHILDAVDDLARRGHDLDFEQNGHVAEHECDALDEIVALCINVLRTSFDVDDDLKDDECRRDEGQRLPDGG